MTVLSAYITRVFFKYFAIVLLLVSVIYLSIDFFGRIDKFIRVELTPLQVLLFFIFKIPMIISQITPVAVLLGVLIVFGLMSKNNEIIALKSSGISVYTLLKPIAVIGLVLSVMLFLFSEVIVPISTVKSNQIYENNKPNRRMMTSREKNIWIRGDQSITYIKYYDPGENMIYGISVIYLDRSFGLRKRINAEKGHYENNRWLLSDCMIQTFNPKKGTQDVVFSDLQPVELDLSPTDLVRVSRESEEMSFAALWNYIRHVQTQGYDATQYRVDLFAKTAFPFICLIMSLMGSGIALRGKTREGMAVSFAYSIFTAFIYWSLYSLSLSLGYGEMLPPILAAWMANLVFLCITGILVVRLD